MTTVEGGSSMIISSISHDGGIIMMDDDDANLSAIAIATATAIAIATATTMTRRHPRRMGRMGRRRRRSTSTTTSAPIIAFAAMALLVLLSCDNNNAIASSSSSHPPHERSSSRRSTSSCPHRPPLATAATALSTLWGGGEAESRSSSSSSISSPFPSRLPSSSSSTAFSCQHGASHRRPSGARRRRRRREMTTTSTTTMMMMPSSSSTSTSSWGMRRRGGTARTMDVGGIIMPASRMSCRLSPPTMTMNDGDVNDVHDDDDDDDDDDDEEEDDIDEVRLNRISWLPSVLLGERPYRRTSSDAVEGEGGGRGDAGATKDAVVGDAARYVDVHRGGGDDDTTSHRRGGGRMDVDDDVGGDIRRGGVGRRVEILPVLPMKMVRGLMMGGEYSMASDDDDDGGESSRYGAGVWEDGGGGGRGRRNDVGGSSSSSSGSGSGLGGGRVSGGLFSGTSGYLPHTRGHVFTVAEPRYKRLYDDLLRLGNYHVARRDGAIRRGEYDDVMGVGASSTPSSSSFLSDPDDKRRFIVTAENPTEDGVFAEYGLLFQLRDLDEVAAVGEGMTLEELEEISGGLVGYANDDDDDDDDDDDVEDVMNMLLRTHYEATHDVVGRVRIHRFVNPECYNDGPEGEEYLMAEATVLDVVENDTTKMRRMIEERKRRLREAQQAPPTTTMTATRLDAQQQQPQQQQIRAVGDVAKAVARIKEELRSSVGEAFEQNRQQQQQQQQHQDTSDNIKGKSRPSLDGAAASLDHKKSGKGPISLGGMGVYVERRSDDSLTKEERSLRDSFARLVALQHELNEECRFTRVSVQTFGVGQVGVWLSAAAWSQFVEKRLEATYDGMQSELQAKLVEYLADSGGLGDSGRGIGGYINAKHAQNDDVMEGSGYVEVGETIDFDDLSPELQQEFQFVQARATEELGPLALERAIQIQCIVQAESYSERLDLLREMGMLK
ncbi:hypothetical protein ACHAXA_007737 [Cyclostephanos tholiformis]|uniref:Uncharacterized protein n=1 Tax=Cyclostephanos tholiformis TaxID=382380 RepID=A0ABD3RY80_9STRA